MAFTSCFSAVVPCGAWQSLQASCPWRTGCANIFWNWPRSATWQVKHTSACVLVESTASLRAWLSWHEAHETSFVACGPLCQALAVDFSWQARHMPFCTDTGAVESREKRITGGRVSPFLTRLVWSPAGPWQASHCSWPLPNGLRASAGWPCLPWNTASVTSSSWQPRQVSAPFLL